MALISTSVVNNVTAKNGTWVNPSTTQTKSDLPGLITRADVEVSQQSQLIQTLKQSLSGTTGDLSAASSQLTGLAGKAGNLAGSLNTTLIGASSKSLLSGIANSVTASLGLNTGLSKALSSITSTFSSSPLALASGIDAALSGIFKDTNISQASTVITSVSDPVKTNLLGSTKKSPISTMFKVSSLEAGSQTVTSVGSSSVFDSNAAKMIGTSLSSVLGRLNLDSAASSLGSALSSFKSTQILGGLFSDPTKLTKQVVGAVTKQNASLTPSGAQAFTNDLNALLGKTSGISSLSGKSVLDYVITDQNKTLTNTNGDICSVSQDVDASSANELLGVARQLGCAVLDGVDYNSAAQEATLFNYILNQSAEMGLTHLLDQLLGCSRAGSDTGQIALSNAFAATSGSNLDIASTILDAITTPHLLKTAGLSRQVVSNPFLTGGDVSGVENMLTKLGTSTKEAMCVPDQYDPTTPLYDLSLLGSAPESFLNGAIGNKAISLYMSSAPQVLRGDGLSWA